jgi:hypothetical protein
MSSVDQPLSYGNGCSFQPAKTRTNDRSNQNNRPRLAKIPKTNWPRLAQTTGQTKIAGQTKVTGQKSDPSKAHTSSTSGHVVVVHVHVHTSSTSRHVVKKADQHHDNTKVILGQDEDVIVFMTKHRATTQHEVVFVRNRDSVPRDDSSTQFCDGKRERSNHSSHHQPAKTRTNDWSNQNNRPNQSNRSKERSVERRKGVINVNRGGTETTGEAQKQRHRHYRST